MFRFLKFRTKKFVPSLGKLVLNEYFKYEVLVLLIVTSK